MRCLELAELPFGFVARYAVSFLDGAKQLIAFAFDAVQVVVGKLAPLFFDLAAELLPLAFYGVPIHGLLLSGVDASIQWADSFDRDSLAEPRVRGRQSASPNSWS